MQIGTAAKGVVHTGAANVGGRLRSAARFPGRRLDAVLDLIIAGAGVARISNGTSAGAEFFERSRCSARTTHRRHPDPVG
jgi:hypothetical protein